MELNEPAIPLTKRLSKPDKKPKTVEELLEVCGMAQEFERAGEEVPFWIVPTTQLMHDLARRLVRLEDAISRLETLEG